MTQFFIALGYVGECLSTSSVPYRPHANLYSHSVLSGLWDFLKQKNIIIIKAVPFFRLTLPCPEIGWQCVSSQNIEIHIV